jgi:Na+/H+ antiporter NhaD/arsenite permease-like protein
MRTAIVGAVLLALGGVAVATGLLPVPEAIELWDRVWPILLFVVAITVVTEFAAEAGVFTALAQQTARWGRGRAWALWLLVVVVAALSTIFLSLDTTAVLLTPVVIVMARHAGLNPLPFALTTVWMANAGSLLLPVSNLTNLLAQHAMGDPTPAAFASLMLAPALVAMVVPMVVVFLIARRSSWPSSRCSSPVCRCGCQPASLRYCSRWCSLCASAVSCASGCCPGSWCCSHPACSCSSRRCTRRVSGR